MEIDFLGLNSSRSPSPSEYGTELQNSKFASTYNTDKIHGRAANEEHDVLLLSLGTSSQLGCRTEIFDVHKKRTLNLYTDKTIQTSSSSSNSTVRSLDLRNWENATITERPCPPLAARSAVRPTGFLYNLNNTPVNLRNIAGRPGHPATLSSLCSGFANIFQDASLERADTMMFVAGNESTMRTPGSGKGTRGYTPTVAMARKATLARFLEKRAHRLKQTTSSLPGKLPYQNTSEGSATNTISCNKKKNRTMRS